MAKTNIRTPFFVFNPKSYLFGENLLELVREADALAEEFPISIFVENFIAIFVPNFPFQFFEISNFNCLKFPISIVWNFQF